MGHCYSTEMDVGDNEANNNANGAAGALAAAYEVKHLLGCGSAGDTYLCRDRSSGELLAVKLIRRPIPPAMGNSIVREVKVGAQLGRGHLSIVQARELILTRTHLGLVMDYVPGGNLAEYICRANLIKYGRSESAAGLVLEEDEACYFFTQIINAVQYCHNHKVAHRDLKLDNTLLDGGTTPPRIKLCDFGFARWWKGQPQMNTITGTPDYLSPQVLEPQACNRQACYDGTKVDIWALGVMLAVMLTGRFPFEGTGISAVTNLGELSLHVWQQQRQQQWCDNPAIAAAFCALSAEARDLLDKMFELDEDERITIPEIKAHPWLCKPLPEQYQQALADIQEEQAHIDNQTQQVASLYLDGSSVNRHREAALKRMIHQAAVRYSPEQEEPVPETPSWVGTGSWGGAKVVALPKEGALPKEHAGVLRRVSLSSIMPFDYEAF